MKKQISLNLPYSSLKISMHDEVEMVWDVVRRKKVKLDPEEWVRQQLIHYFIDHKNYPLGLMKVETMIKVNGRTKRPDLVVHDKAGKPKMIVELKSPEVKIDQSVFMQIASYNLTLQVDYLLISNGLEHYCFFLDKEKKEMNSLDQIPDYKDLLD